MDVIFLICIVVVLKTGKSSTSLPSGSVIPLLWKQQDLCLYHKVMTALKIKYLFSSVLNFTESHVYILLDKNLTFSLVHHAQITQTKRGKIMEVISNSSNGIAYLIGEMF